MSDLYIETRLQAIKDIASASCADIKDADNIASFCDEIYSAIPKIDKIVEELKKNASRYTKKYVTPYGNNGYKDTKAISVHKAIEIVKQGDLSDNVCEWKLDGDNLTTGCGDYFNLYDNCTGKFKYCPICGKKIKAVE